MRLVFDATFSEIAVGQLRGFFQSHKVPRPIFSHIHEFGGRDTPDDVWLEGLKPLDCIVFSGDVGRRAPRLPDICEQLGKTHILISPALQNDTQFVKLRAIVVLWPDIEKAAAAPKGTRFVIQPSDGTHQHFKWIPK